MNEKADLYESKPGDRLRLRCIDSGTTPAGFTYAVLTQDMDGKTYRSDDPEEDGRLVILTETFFQRLLTGEPDTDKRQP